ncbi:hypothetical protein [Terriglobus tenax]|uniref:hypothetical protein n=1 Tax=Terriglobus tenax TaxID=1111115 RepID=UPI0021E04C3F|nr:hypothetical protein [Terriglobus tenax]
MARKTQQQPKFDQVLSTLGNQKFDVSAGANGAKRVSKYGCAAEVRSATDGTTEITVRPGWLLKGEIARLVDKGYQKFLKAGHTEIPATADNLRQLHTFSEELKEIIGANVLYNEALGTTSDRYVYDRVLGRA